ncbi:MAG: DUF5069 domain-containing protein [Puniceicoccaceae bacterium]
MDNYKFSSALHQIWTAALEKYQAGNREPGSYFEPATLELLASVGLGPMDVYDYVEDFAGGGEPDFGTFLLICAARRDYFIHIQHSEPSTAKIAVDDLPAKDAQLDGITWLPRILPKARGKLAGELPSEIMYCCGGDRRFLRESNIEPSEFLRVVWAAGDDDQKVLEFVKSRRNA